MAVVIVLTLGVLLVLRLLLPAHLTHVLGPRELTAAALLPLLATFSPFYIAFAIAVAAIIVFAPALGHGGAILLRPDAIERRLRLLFFCMPLLPILQCTFMVSGFTIVQLQYVTILCLALCWALAAGGYTPPGDRLRNWDTTFAMMMLVQLFMDARDNDLLFSVRALLQVVLNVGLPYYAVSRAFAAARAPRDLFVALLLAASAIAALTFVESFKHWLLYDGMQRAIGADPEIGSGYAKIRGGMLRARATFPESTGLSLFLSVALTMLFALRRQIASKPLLLAMAVVLSGALFVTFARVGYIATVAGLVMCLVHERRFGQLAKLAAVLPVVALGLIALGHNVPIVSASLGTSNDAAGSVDYRTMLIDGGLDIVRANPILGLSLPDIYAKLEYLRQGEGIIDLVNQPLTIFMRSGVAGGVLYFLMTVRVVATLFTRARRLDPGERACAAACFAGVIGLLVGLTTTSFGRNETTFVMLLGAGAGLVARRRAVAAVGSGVKERPETPAAPQDIPLPHPALRPRA